MNEKIKKLLLSGNFQDGQELIKHMDCGEIVDTLIIIGFASKSVSVYSFVCSLLISDENAEKHFMAADLLSQPLCRYEGAYSTGFFMQKKHIT